MAGAETARSPSDSRPVVAVVFDAVGTLIYADPPVADVYQDVAEQIGSRLTRDEIRQRFRRALISVSPVPASSLTCPPTSEEHEFERWRSIVANVVNDVPPAGADDLFAKLWQHFARPTSWRLFEDVEPTWRELGSRGYRLGIASNFDSRLRTVLAGLPPLDNVAQRGRESSRPTSFDVDASSAATTPDPFSLFISSEIGFPKPDPRFFRSVQQRLGLEPSQILLVGDDWTNDIVGGRSAGWSTVWINRDCEAPPQPVHFISHLSELLAVLPPRFAP